MIRKQRVLYEGKLDNISIDELSESIGSYFGAANATEKDVLRLRLSAEEAMNIWASKLGKQTPCCLLKREIFGKTTLVLQAEGISIDPSQYQDETLLSISSNPNLVVALGLPAIYSYNNGRNVLKLSLPRKKISTFRQIVIAILLAVVIGFGLKYFLPVIGSKICVQLLEPLSDMFTNLLHLIAGPLVFLSIISGINGIGDASSFEKMGVFLIKRFLLIMLTVSALSYVCLYWMFPVTSIGTVENSGNALSELLQVILNIVPSDIVSPFQTGNAMQIIFLAICIGVAGILLGESVSGAVFFADQINAMTQFLMNGISKLLPVYIFLCISDLIIDSDTMEILKMFTPIILIIALTILLPLGYGVYASISIKKSFSELLKAQLPTYFIAFATASSAAAYISNVECCENKLKVNSKLVQFGVPFGQVLFMPGTVVLYNILALCTAEECQMTITPVWALTLIFISSVLAMATPPIPGGALSSMMVLFTQLGIPTNGMAICATIIILTDYVVTACNVACLQQELMVSGKKLNLIEGIRAQK